MKFPLFFFLFSLVCFAMLVMAYMKYDSTMKELFENCGGKCKKDLDCSVNMVCQNNQCCV